MPGELLVDERIVRVEELEHAAILAQRAADKQLGLALERLHQREVVIRITLRIDHDLGHAAEIQPLRGEVVDERFARARIGEHALDLLLEHLLIAQLPSLGERQELVVGDAGPEEEGQTGGQLEI